MEVSQIFLFYPLLILVAKNKLYLFRKIANDLGISTDTVARRYKKLKQDGTIKPVIQINPTKIGYYTDAYFLLTFNSQQSFFDIIEQISKILVVILILKTSGVFDLTIKVMVKNIKQLIVIQNEITSIPNIINWETRLMKTAHSWPTPRDFKSAF